MSADPLSHVSQQGLDDGTEAVLGRLVIKRLINGSVHIDWIGPRGGRSNVYASNDWQSFAELAAACRIAERMLR